jgi:pseudaminic acid cytidylyltransferase
LITAALIPARGGSKRLPRKNVVQVAGQPMLAYPVRAARDSGLFDRIYVSTEDSEIADVARQLNVAVIDRPSALAQDRSTVVDVCVHALDVDPQIDRLCCIYATSMLLTPETLVRSSALLDTPPAADVVMGVSEYPFPPVQALKEDEHGFVSYMWPEWRGIQSQFHPRLVVSNGTFYWARAEALKRNRTFYSSKTRPYLVPAAEVTDINTEEDLTRATAQLRAR